MKRIILVLVGMGMLMGLGLGGCVVVHHDPAAPAPRGGYKPPVYKGHTVYFTSRGAPYYCKGSHRARLPDHQRSQYATYYHNHQRGHDGWVQGHPAPCAGQPWHGSSTSHPRPHRRPGKSHRR